MRRTPTRTLLSPVTSGSRTLTTTAAAPVDTRPAELEPAELARRLELHALLGRRLGRLLGMTTTWATTRWIGTSRLDGAVPVFHIRVPGARPSRATGRLVTERLGRHGWAGRLIAERDEFRIDAQRDGASLVLVAHDNTISLTVRGAAVPMRRSQVRLLLAGVYEDELAA